MEAGHLDFLELVCYAIVSFATAILSGIAGGGAGFINAPLLILFGLSPAQAIATGKLTGLSVALSSLSGLRGVATYQTKKQLIIIVSLALAAGLFAPFVITNLDSTLYRRTIGFVMLATIPIMLFKKLGQISAQSSARKQALGYGLLVPALLLQGIFGAGMGTLVNIVLMAFLGMSALESSVAKRYTQVVLNVVIIFGVIGSNLIIWPAAVMGVVTSAIGGYIGTRIAVRRGNTLIAAVLIVLTLASAIYLIVS